MDLSRCRGRKCDTAYFHRGGHFPAAVRSYSWAMLVSISGVYAVNESDLRWAAEEQLCRQRTALLGCESFSAVGSGAVKARSGAQLSHRQAQILKPFLSSGLSTMAC